MSETVTAKPRKRPGRKPIGDRRRSHAEQMRADRNKDRLITFRAPVPDIADRRAALEPDPEAWLCYYLAERFPLPFGPVHREIIKATVRGMLSGTSVTVAAPRGFGKTAILMGMALYGVLTGKVRFPVVIGWKAGAGAELLDQWLEALASNERLAAAYPCVCDCFRDSTESRRLHGILRELDPEQRAGCDVRKVRGMVLIPETREPSGRTLPQAALGGASMNGSIKGLNVGLLDGESLRPDFVMLDDPQDTATAQSRQLIEKVIKRIDYGIRSLSGPQRRLTVMAAVTCVERDDVSERLLARPGTDAIRCGQILTWPEGWDEPQSKMRAGWDKWNAARIEGLTDHDGGRMAREHYAEHRDALTAGMTVSWEHRYHVGDEERDSDPDALFAAMWDFYDLGEAAFLAERQNAPMENNPSIYEITADLIASRIHTGRKQGEIPPEARLIVAATDINHYGLHTSALAFANDQTAWCAWYGRFDGHGRGIVPKNCPEVEAKRLVFEALVHHGQQIAATPLRRGTDPVRVGMWIIDGGYMHDVVQRYASGPGRTLGVTIVTARGYNADRYRPTGKNLVGEAREGCHLTESTVGRFLAFNADYWREVGQRAWLGTPNAPGSLSLFEGRHHEFAEQICREKLIEKLQAQSGYVWRWHTAPGWHDWGDAVTMCYAGAAWGGIGTTGRRPQRRRYVETRKAKVQVEE